MVAFRRAAAEILRSVRRGEAFVLTYRGAPVARLEPIQPEGEELKGDPIYALCEHAVEGGESLTNQEIDDILYG
ncbi:MAG TPA: hypothetical protein VLU25_09180 [Acidobacteriota bacterium]|nr:hypothetical protein [Acidobacteriota bacterium]